MRLLVTGSSGFIGSALIQRVRDIPELEVRAAVRRRTAVPTAARETIVVGDLSQSPHWGTALREVDCVVHSAARVHVMSDEATDPDAEYRRTNVVGTVNLARQAAAAGVRRFVFLSSIKVNGEATAPGQPFRPDDPPAPQDAYARSKHEAELALHEVAAETGLEVVVIRPVLTYGPGVRANFRSMMRWLHRGVPMPLGSIRNRRSLVAIDNLVDLMVTCVRHPNATGQTFLVSDGEDLSTPDLLRRLAATMGKKAHLFPVPPLMMRGFARVVGREAAVKRVCSSLQVDISKTRELLGWKPVVDVDTALAATVRDFLSHEAERSRSA